jgi:hypothetical protein
MAVKVKDADWKPGGPAKPLPSLASFHVGETYLVPDGRRVQEVGARLQSAIRRKRRSRSPCREMGEAS